MGMFTTIIEPTTEGGIQIKTGFGRDQCETYRVGDSVKWGEPDGVYEGVGREAGSWFELWEVVIEGGTVASCTRYPDGTPSKEEPEYLQLPRD